jgi:hypothetical protein
MNHNRISKLGTIFTLILVVLLAGTIPAAAQAERIYYTGTDCTIIVGPPERQWVSEDGVLHQRGVPMIDYMTYEPEWLNGTNYEMGNFDIDLSTGAVHVYGTFELHTGGGDGTWVGRFSTHVSPEGVVDGRGVGHGTGDFEGMTTFNTISSPEAPDPLCDGVTTSGNGYILIPNP